MKGRNYKFAFGSTFLKERRKLLKVRLSASRKENNQAALWNPKEVWQVTGLRTD